MNKNDDPELILQQGSSVLDPLMHQYKFLFQYNGVGKGSGGKFAYGSYVKNNRKLELHYRFSLGLVTYHIDEYHLEHSIYMQFLDVYDKASYPGFSTNPIDAFHHLKQDLENFGLDFLDGEGKQFKKFAQEYLDCPNKFKGFKGIK